MRIRRSLTVVGVLAVLAGCATLQSLRGNVTGALTVGMSGTYPPFTFAEGLTGSLAGIEVDFANVLALEIGRPVQIVRVPFPNLIGELNAGRIDVVMAGMSVTKERSALVDFTSPYLEIGQMALVRKEDDARLPVRDWVKLDGLRVGFERGTTGGMYVLSKLKRAEPVEFTNKQDALDALQQRKIDVLVHDAPFVWRTVGSPQAPDKEVVGRFTLLTEENLAWAVRKGNGSLLAQLNSVLASWKSSGQIDAVLDRWIKVRKISRPIPRS